MDASELSNRFPEATSGVSLQDRIQLHKFIIIFLTALNFVFVLLLRYVGGQMYPFFITVFLWSAAYISFLASLLWFSKKRGSTQLSHLWSRSHLLTLIGLTMVPRFIFIGAEPLINIDALYYLDFGRLMSNGNMPYADFYFPYPPVFAYLILAVALAAPIIDSFRVISTIFDVGIIIILWSVCRQRETNLSQIIPAAYAMLPISIIESGLNGHFEPAANLFLLLAMWSLINGRINLSAVSMGLSAATKIYAGILIPAFLMVLPNHRKRILYVATSLVTAYITFIPFSIPVWIRGDFLAPGAAMPGGSGGFLDSMFGFLIDLDAAHTLTFLLVGGAVLIVFGVLVSRTFHSDKISLNPMYNLLGIGIGILLAIMAATAAVYPYTSLANAVYWRYPTDIALVRGASALIASAFIIRIFWGRWRHSADQSMSMMDVAFLAAALIALLLTISRDIFTGWYLLWALPLLLMVRDRKIAILSIVCLLLIYPSYIHDDFISLGYAENRVWSDDFESIEDWVISLENYDNTSLQGEILVNTDVDDSGGIFSVDSHGVQNITALQRTIIVWSRDVSFLIDEFTEFAFIAATNWDPTFGPLAHVTLLFNGLDQVGKTVNGTIIPPDFSFTNLTNTHWRYSFRDKALEESLIEVRQLHLELSPLQPARMELYIETLYTSQTTLFSIASIPLIVVLLMPNILAVVVVRYLLNNKNSKYGDEM